jgi:hypothetical protein
MDCYAWSFKLIKTSFQELAKRMFPLCESYLLIDQFVESRSQFKNGLVNHAFAAALKALLVVGSLCCKSFDYYTCVARWLLHACLTLLLL